MDKPARSALIKLMMTYFIECDFSCQEAAHIILGLPLIEKSFKVVSINLSSSSRVMLNTEVLDDDNDDVDFCQIANELCNLNCNSEIKFHCKTKFDNLCYAVN